MQRPLETSTASVRAASDTQCTVARQIEPRGTSHAGPSKVLGRKKQALDARGERNFLREHENWEEGYRAATRRRTSERDTRETETFSLSQ
ncbi:hypothetical protein CLIM01_00059 [Colletotrichum limetticola]|uniref:Uncharacterized protein n=1 Tax=Colletotrichum limetticola TaxID=1209924 RepID=A0ABQ9QFH8_9PEZI|nr:hypothetical protein CLIM01_00059 [Colletotrichum limetticola]